MWLLGYRTKMLWNTCWFYCVECTDIFQQYSVNHVDQWGIYNVKWVTEEFKMAITLNTSNVNTIVVESFSRTLLVAVRIFATFPCIQKIQNNKQFSFNIWILNFNEVINLKLILITCFSRALEYWEMTKIRWHNWSFC